MNKLRKIIVNIFPVFGEQKIKFSLGIEFGLVGILGENYFK